MSKCEAEFKHREMESITATQPYDISSLLEFPDKFKEAWFSGRLDVVVKKRILRCLIKDVTLCGDAKHIWIGIRFAGGAEELIEAKRPPQKHETWTTDPEIVEYIRNKSRKHTVGEIVSMLNSSGIKSGKGSIFTPSIVRGIQYNYKIPSLKQ